MNTEDFIGCPRFGGRRPALACVHYDRYKSCRRYCDSLGKWIKENPNYEVVVKETYKREGSKLRQAELLPVKHSGKGVPNPDTACKFCKFSAKSRRGLKTHMTRKHKKAA